MTAVLDRDGRLTDEALAERGWVFVPTAPPLGPGDPVRPELRRTGDERLALPAYTSLAELVSGCGPHQPWVLVPADWLERMGEECRCDVIVLNAVLCAEWRHQERTWPGRAEVWDE